VKNTTVKKVLHSITIEQATLIGILILTITIIIVSVIQLTDTVEQSACTIEDTKYASNDYIPEEAYSFGMQIQQAIKDRNLDTLFNLVDDELQTGPRRKYIKGKKFSDIFSENWVDKVLAESPSCSPVGWRGFMLGNGNIWYGLTDNGWTVISINSSIPETFEQAENSVWDVDNKILSPQCFTTIWNSYDNYEVYEERFNISDIDDFRSSPSKYLGKEISSLKPISSSWDNTFIQLISPLNQCAIKSENMDATISMYDISDKSYEVMTAIPVELCQSLAPNLTWQCIESNLVKVTISGGSSWDINHNIYGLFLAEDGEKHIVPLKNFNTENEARNFLDDSTDF
jgi:hypothetical protein